jgi:hypothetical protein
MRQLRAMEIVLCLSFSILIIAFIIWSDNKSGVSIFSNVSVADAGLWLYGPLGSLSLFIDTGVGVFSILVFYLLVLAYYLIVFLLIAIYSRKRHHTKLFNIFGLLLLAMTNTGSYFLVKSFVPF